MLRSHKVDPQFKGLKTFIKCRGFKLWMIFFSQNVPLLTIDRYTKAAIFAISSTCECSKSNSNVSGFQRQYFLLHFIFVQTIPRNTLEIQFTHRGKAKFTRMHNVFGCLLASCSLPPPSWMAKVNISFAISNNLNFILAPVQFLSNALLFYRVHCVKLFTKIAVKDILARIVRRPVA